MPPSYLVFTCFIFLLALYTKADDPEALFDLKSSLQTSDADVFLSWQYGNYVCNFTGITCGYSDSVTEIDLSHRDLYGVVPFYSLCQLPFLEKLSLGFNKLSGPVSEDLNMCVSLKYLDVGNNMFSGSFPDISALTRLEFLRLELGGFSGQFPWKSLGNMAKLSKLSVGDNRFDQTPFPEEILGLVNLRWLYMSNCSIVGAIPDGVGRLTKLVNLELAQNQLNSSIPETIGNLENLWQLELYDNFLTGTLPRGMRNLTKLENFDASMNRLTGDLSELNALTSIVSLQLFENCFTGEVPAEFGDFHRLVNLSLYRNNLTGPLPLRLGSWSKFDFIDVSENMLSGPIPPYMCNKGTLKGLLMLANNLSGEIPESYSNCTSLVRFRVSNNELYGDVPGGIWGLPRADIIDLAYNYLEGGLTSDIRTAASLKSLLINDNKFSGEIPPEISSASDLVTVDISDNQFSGPIPSSMGDLKKINYVRMHNNKLSGSIPGSLGSCVQLNVLNLANNELSSSIPSSLGNVKSLSSLDLSGNNISGEIPSSLGDLKLSFLNLSNNQLSGSIPKSLFNGAYNDSFLGNEGLWFVRASSPSQESKHTTLLICLSLILLLLVIALVWVLHSTKDGHLKRSLKEEAWDVSSFHVLTFSEDIIIASIKDENIVGKGGSGNVYKVSLQTGEDLAVKHCRQKLAKRKEFEAEVRALSSIRHVNVVKLFCSITSEDSSLLVYEYLPNGSLWDQLHSSRKTKLDWGARYDVAVGAAKGLEYLHHGCEKPVIHCDVKSSNILLDEFFKPRIADFGLAKIDGGTDSTRVIAGTLGYIAPEYGYGGKVNEMSDVYSFGVVLMELVSGKKPIEAEFGENKDIVDWVSSSLKTKESVLAIVDSSISDIYKEDAVKVLRVAIACTARNPCVRPAMRNVVHMLGDAEPCKFLGILVARESKEAA